MTDISIIIPVYNDPRGLEDTLDAVVEQTYPEESYEVIVVDNDSDDETPEVASSYAERFSNVSVLVEDQIQSSYAARNTGIERATGKILVFLDADVVVGRDWLQAGARAMEKRELDYMGCHVEVFIPDGENAKAARYNKRTDFPVQLFIQEDNFAPTCGLFVRKTVIDDVGTFDAELVLEATSSLVTEYMTRDTTSVTNLT